jgi:DNA-binding transcriptional LysR family regulator
MHLHSRALKYLDEVTRTGSIRKAAMSLHVTPSAIDRRILLLEEQLGTAIYERHASGLRLTAAGEILAQHIRRTLQDLERTRSEIEDLRGLRRGRVSIAVIEGVAIDLLSTVLTEFGKSYPHITFSITVAPSAAIPTLVASGEAHIGVSFNSPITRGVHRIASAELEIGVVMRPDHPLASKKSIRVVDCAHYPICFATTSISVTSVVNDALSQQNIDLEPFIMCNSVETLKALVRDGAGLMFKSRLGIEREIRNDELIFRPLVEKLTERLLLIEQSGRKLPPIASKLQEYFKDALAAMEMPRNRGAHPRKRLGTIE